MPRTVLRSVPALVFVLAAVAWVGVSVSSQSGAPYFPSTKNGEWTHYTADVRGSKYSLGRIRRLGFHGSIAGLQADNARPRPVAGGTPLMVKGVLTAAGTCAVVAWRGGRSVVPREAAARDTPPSSGAASRAGPAAADDRSPRPGWLSSSR